MPELKEINIILGKRIKEIRNKNNMTQEKLAEKIDVSIRFLADVEAGKAGLSLANLKKICSVLSISSDYLLGITEFEPKDILVNSIENKMSAMTPETLSEFDAIADSIIRLQNQN